MPSDSLSPLPNCWTNTVRDSVGLKNSTVSASGISTPSLKRSTVNMQLISPVLSFSLALFLSSVLDLEWSAIDETPALLKDSAIKFACSIPTQNPRAFISPISLR